MEIEYMKSKISTEKFVVINNYTHYYLKNQKDLKECSTRN